uniref:Uncharacterized protein n=1 Tax=Providencia rettgeri TaxID=587 RepID=A0A0U3JZ74_PRORE|nr:hypothetical protein AOY08_100066 [Providencia rettgeri]
MGLITRIAGKTGALGTIGPILVLAAVFLMRAYGWQSGGLLYVGLALMVGGVGLGFHLASTSPLRAGQL